MTIRVGHCAVWWTLAAKQEAITYLNLAIARFPQHAPEALVEKARYLKALNSPKSATKHYKP